MILNHLWGLYAHPHTEWHTIDERHDSFRNSLTHILLVALIPPICAYYSAVHIGWSIGVGDPITLTANSAFKLSVAMYVTLIVNLITFVVLNEKNDNPANVEPARWGLVRRQCFF